MKRIFLITLLLAASCWVAQAQIDWLSREHNFGAFAEELGPVTTEFKFVNTTDHPVSILHAQASCGCTKPGYPDAPIEAGDTATVSVTYNPKGRPGRFNKSVKVKTDASPETFLLIIEGVVIGSPKTLTTNYPVACGDFSLKQTVVNFGDIVGRQIKNKFVDGYNLSSDTIRPRIINLPPYIDADVAPAAVGPGVQFIVSLFFNGTRADNVYGLTDNTAYITLGDGKQPCALSLIANVSEDFSSLSPKQIEQAPRIAVSETSVDLGQVTRGETVSRQITIDNFGRNPLIIRKIQISDDNRALSVVANKTSIKKNGKATLTVTVNTADIAAADNLINLRAIIITNDPQHPITPLRVVGELH